MNAAKLLNLPVRVPPIRKSNLRVLHECKRKFLLQERFGLKRGEHSTPLYRGTQFHLAMQRLYLGDTVAQMREALEAAHNRYIAELQEWVGATGQPELAGQWSREAQKELRVAQAMAELQWEAYPLDRTAFEVVTLEEKLTVPYGDTQGSGTVDMLLRHLQEPKGLLITDHKTKDGSPLDKVATMGFGHELNHYRWLVEESKRFPGERVIGFAYNVIRVPTIRQKEWQSLDCYVEEVRDWYTGGKRTDVVGTDGKPRKWDHSDNPLTWRLGLPNEDRPMLWKVKFFTDPIASDWWDVLDDAALLSNYCPYLELYPRTGEITGRCTGRGSTCPYLPMCELTDDEWEDGTASRLAAKFYRVESDYPLAQE